MKEKINIDKLFRDKLEGFTVDPPDYLWNGIRDRMAQRRRKRRIAYITRAAVAAVIILTFFSGWHFYNKKEIINPDLAQQQKKNDPKQNLGTSSPSEHVSAYSEGNIMTEDIQLKTNPPAIDRNKRYEAVSENHHQEKITTDNDESLAAMTASRISYLPVNRINVFFPKGLNANLAECRTVNNNDEKEFDNNDILSDRDRMLVAENIRKYGEKKKKINDSWILGAGVSPGYASHTSSYSSKYKKDANISMSGGVKNLSGGISVQYKTGKNLRVESGVYYAQNSQSPEYSAGKESYASYAVAIPYRSGVEEQDNSSGLYANAVDIQRNEITANSNAGVIKLTNIPSNAEIATSLQKNSKATLLSENELKQVFDFVEIPLYLRYRVWEKKKVGIDFVGGVNAGIIVSNKVYLGGQDVGTTKDISTLNVLGTLGVGVNYRLSNHFLLAMEPRVNYYLNSINTSGDVTYKPYRVGVFTGFYYEF